MAMMWARFPLRSSTSRYAEPTPCARACSWQVTPEGAYHTGPCACPLQADPTIDLTSFEVAVIVGMFNIVAALGCLLAGPITDWAGRKVGHSAVCALPSRCRSFGM